MCNVFRISRSGYYAWQSRKPSGRQVETDRLTTNIQMIYQESKNRYGSPKIAHELMKRNITASRPRVARIMRSQGMKSIISKKYRCNTTDSNHLLPISENHIDRDFSASRLGEKWVGDITYIPTKQGWLYLTIVLDLFDRRIIGWALSINMIASDTSNCCMAYGY
jgi:putative transposase